MTGREGRSASLVLAGLGPGRDRGIGRRPRSMREAALIRQPPASMPSSSILGPVAISNFPQAFTHLALINALTHVIRRGRARHASLAAGDWRPGGVIRAPSAARCVVVPQPDHPRLALEPERAHRTGPEPEPGAGRRLQLDPSRRQHAQEVAVGEDERVSSGSSSSAITRSARSPTSAAPLAQRAPVAPAVQPGTSARSPRSCGRRRRRSPTPALSWISACGPNRPARRSPWRGSAGR